MHPFLLTYIQHLLKQAHEAGIQRFVVGGLIEQNKKVLCLKRAGHDFLPGLYELPSGKVEKGEDLLTTLHREIKEESNLIVTDTSDYLGYFDYTSRSGTKTRQFNFTVKCSNYQDIKLNPEEHEGFSWVNQEELSKYNISQEVKNCIQTFYYRSTLNISSLDLIAPAIENSVGRFVVGAIINFNNKALILKRASNDFMGGIDELPSGKVENGESLETALLREAKEEAGVSVARITNYIGSFDYTSKSGVKTRQFTFAVLPNANEKIQLSSEHEGYALISQNEINRYQLSPEVKAQLNLFFQPTPTAVLAEQTGIFSSKRKPSDSDSEKPDNSKRLATEKSDVTGTESKTLNAK